MSEKYIVRVALGDEYDDGHGKSYSINIESNLKEKEIKKAYNIGSKKVNVNLLSLCEEFECSYIPKKEYDKLIDNGYKFSETTICYTEDDTVDIQIDEYINIWLFLVKNGNENFEYSIIESDYEMNIGGYGLF
jgi:hypothetical protein